MEKANTCDASTSENKTPDALAKTITPAILGLPSSHGVKLSMNMTSKDKKELLFKLEEWRKARREKLAASILAKKKPLEKSKISAPIVPVKARPNALEIVEGENGCFQKIQDRETVFERLYKNSGRMKKQESKVYSLKTPQPKNTTLKQRVESFPQAQNLENSNKPINAEKEQVETCQPSSRRPISQVRDATEVTGGEIQGSLFTLSKTKIAQQQIAKLPQSAKENSADEAKLDIFSEETVKTFYEKSSFEEELLVSGVESTNDMTVIRKEDIESKKIADSMIKVETLWVEDKTEGTSSAEKPEETSKIEKVCLLSVPEENSQTFVKVKNEKSGLESMKKDAAPIQTEIKKCCKPNALNSKTMSNKAGTKSNETAKFKTSLRRSLSMLYRKKYNIPRAAVHKTVSEKNLHELKLNKEYEKETSIFRPISSTQWNLQRKINKMDVKSVSFATPQNNKLLNSTHLRNKLENWLKVNGHPLEGYRHLRCFDVAHTAKCLMPNSGKTALSNSMETSLYCTAPNTPVADSDKENVTPLTVPHPADKTDVENWLKELYRLIVELKYPLDRCEEWLIAIRRKCPTCTQLHIYWECLAALDESKGDMKSAIEYYERAIIKGAKVDSVGESLAQLFDKMVIEQRKPRKTKLEKGLDPKNIFKSTIIKFALQQKALKELGSKGEDAQKQLYIATPVRRSSRIQTPYKSHVVSSLQSLTPEVRENIKFKPNESLLNGE